MTRCPCLSGLGYDECCGKFHAGDANAPTAERLMRSRYSAYALGNAAYVKATWHPSTRPADLVLDSALTWYRLDILGRSRGGMLDTVGTVEFRASYRIDGRSDSQQETSSFVRENGLWYYVDGE